MSTCSVSKGCFVFKPSSKKRRVSQKTANDFTERKDDSEDTELRFVTCQSLWKQIRSETEQIQEDLNKQLFDNLVSFLRRSHSEFQEKTTKWTCRMKSREIPTAALVLGVNVTDHDMTFRSLSEVLQNSITPYIALLEAKDCPGIKNLMQKLMGQLMNSYIDVDSLEDEDYVQVSQNRIRCSMTSLIKWYGSVTKQTALKRTDSETPSKKRASSSRQWQSPPVVVIFKDMESFTTKVLQDFIVISRYVESQASEKQIALLTVDDYLKETAQKLLEDLYVYHENYVSVLRCLHVLTSSLPKYPLGKQIRELHCACLENQVWETEEYESSLQLARMLNKSDLVTMLQQCVEIFVSSSGKEFGKTVEKLKEFLTQFQKLEVAEASQEQDASASSQKELQKTTDLYHLQKTLLELKESRRSKKLSKFEMLRFEVVDYIDSLVRNYLVPADHKTLHEIVYFNTASILRGHLNAAPRIALHTALNNPYCYLKHQALKSDGGSISNKAPDICIVYKLHLECGRLINLVDWLEAFSTVVTAAEGPNADAVSSDQVDDVIHARFIRAVSELELLGFIKPSKQKTDHVARLTWGGC
ncbi:origin recognition complex subunit 3 isoform 6-T6 [Morus bassanus]